MSREGYWVTGIHAIKALLGRRPQAVSRLLVGSGRSHQRLHSLRLLAAQNNIVVEDVDSKELLTLAENARQGVAALISCSKSMLSETELLNRLQTLEHPPLLLVLDGVTDPHNLGACLRTADAAGVDGVIIPKDRSVHLNATVSRVASGAAETVAVVSVINLVRCLKGLQERDVWIVGTDGGAQTSLFQQDLKGPLALVMGSEGAGMRRLTRESCDFLVTVPMAGQLSSLNVSVATGIALFEAVRQRQGANAASI